MKIVNYLHPDPIYPIIDVNILSAMTGTAMDASITIAKVIGPSVSGATRGEKFLEIGFIQNARWTRKHALYDGFTPKKRRRSSLQDDIYHLDTDPVDDPKARPPWYDAFNTTGSDGLLDNLPSGGVTNLVLNVTDSPKTSATDSMVLGADIFNSDMADKFGIVDDFNLYLAVRTVQNVNGSKEVYTQRGKATWQFDGSGDIDATGLWKLTGKGNTGNASFSEVTEGDVVPVTTGIDGNTLLETTQTWTTENQ